MFEDMANPMSHLNEAQTSFKPDTDGVFSDNDNLDSSAAFGVQSLPFIYTPWLNRTLYQLLSISHHFTETAHAMAPELFFPFNLAIYDVTSAYGSPNDQWTSYAHIDGVRVEGCASSYFARNGGLTPQDRKHASSATACGFQSQQIWQYVVHLFSGNYWSMLLMGNWSWLLNTGTDLERGGWSS